MVRASRRDFISGLAGAVAFAGGCKFGEIGRGAPMAGFAAPPLKRIRIGIETIDVDRMGFGREIGDAGPQMSV